MAAFTLRKSGGGSTLRGGDTLRAASSSVSSGALNSNGASSGAFVGSSIVAGTLSSDGVTIANFVGSVDGIFASGALDVRANAGGGGGLVVDAAEFVDADLMSRASAYTDDTKLTVTGFFKTADVGTTGVFFWLANDGKAYVAILADGTLQFFCSGGALSLSLTTTETYNDGNWHSFCISVDTDFSAGNKVYSFYVDRSVPTITELDLFDAFAIDLGGAGSDYVFLSAGFSDDATACGAEITAKAGIQIDFSNATNLNKFVTTDNKPENIGTDGSTAYGSAAHDYFHLDDTEAVANFATNRGSLGNMTITGTLATCATSPSDGGGGGDTVFFTGASTASAVITSAGASTVTFLGSSVATGALNSSGVSSGTFIGSSVVAGVLSSNGVATADFVGSVGGTVVSGEFQSAGAGTVSLVGAAVASGALSIAGSATLTLTGAAVASGALNALGVSTAEFFGAVGGSTVSGDLSISGASTAIFGGSSVVSGALFSEGIATVSLVGAEVTENVQSGDLLISGYSSVSFVGDSIGSVVVPIVPDLNAGGAVGYRSGGNRRRAKIKLQDERDLADITFWLENEYFRKAA